MQPLAERGDSINFSDSTTSLSRCSSSDESSFSEVLNAWEAKLDAEPHRPQQQPNSSRILTHNTAASTRSSGPDGDNAADATGRPSGAGGSSAPVDSRGLAAPGGFSHAQPDRMLLPRRPISASPHRCSPTSGAPPTLWRPSSAVVSEVRASCRSSGGAGSKLRCSTSAPNGIGSSSAQSTATGGGSRGAGAAPCRRAAFVAGGSLSSLLRRRDTAAAIPPVRDILLSRLPGPALDIIVPALQPAIRAALRSTCKVLRALVDGHTHSLSLRPERRVADQLTRRGTKAFTIFPALRHATVILAGSCSNATTATSSGPSAEWRPSSTASCQASSTGAPSAAADSLLPLSSWLLVCGQARCLTSLALHVGDVPLTEGLAMSITHRHLQRLELFIGRSGNPHASPPSMDFMIGMLPGLRHLGITWAGGSGAGGFPSLASLAHGSRRLFLDGRPRLGAGLLSGLANLSQLESLELRGFLIDTEGHSVLSNQWPRLAGRLKRLVLSQLHLMVASTTPQEQQLGELVAGCTRLCELRTDLWLPASAGMPGLAAVAAGGPGAAAAAALLISLMYASRDVRAIRAQVLPVSLTRLALTGICLTRPDDLAPLSRLRSLISLEVTALGPGAGDYLPVLQELRLIGCYWRQLLDMLPWHSAAAQQSSTCTASVAQHPHTAIAASAAAGAEAAVMAFRGCMQQQFPGGRGEGFPATGGGGGERSGREGREDENLSRAAGMGSSAIAHADPATGAKGISACGELKALEVVVCERLDDWEAHDRGLLTRVGRAILPLVDGGCRVRLKVAQDAQPNIWNESDEDGKPWEPVAVWRHIKAAQNLRRLQAETKALADRMARGRMLQAARRKQKELQFFKR